VKKRRFSKEFKREAVQLAQDSGKTLTQVARELGLGTSLLARWVREAEAGAARSGKKPDADEELKAARKEIARLKMEVEILGKAAAFFANRNK
jgi:transposase